MATLLIGGLGTTELVLIVLVVLLLFGATKLPELARGSGRALRIFKAETKGLVDDDTKTDEERELEARAQAQAQADAERLEAERIARERRDQSL
jgi:sec-independent protein translocase protein TatA